ncbi:ceramide synthase 4-like isoform X2 [Notamacropus eugenii]|uniref:ceramide synthase 4-like isoform X2 n=1 Tax=Notamacropus eugenii TaxID=9315 RepID=UPI003B683948
MLVSLYDWFWNEKYWFPQEYSWADFEDSDEVVYPHPKDLLAVVPLTFVIIIVRYTFERTVALPLSRLMGVRDGRKIKASHNPILESFFRTQSQNPKEAQMSHLATQCNLSLRQVQCWFRHRRNQERPLLSAKFSEACWKFIFYFSSFFGGLLTVYNEPWFWKPELCWDGFPKQALKPAIYWWYLLEFGFYLSLLITLSFDIKRKAGKMVNYAQWKNSSEITFVIFTVVFLICRLIFLPYKILYSTYYSSMENHKPFFGYYFSNALLMILQVLNIFWASLILHMFYIFVILGKVPYDVRSDLEEQGTGDEQSEKEKQESRNRVKSQTLSTFSSPGVSRRLSTTKKHCSVPTI